MIRESWTIGRVSDVWRMSVWTLTWVQVLAGDTFPGDATSTSLCACLKPSLASDTPGKVSPASTTNHGVGFSSTRGQQCSPKCRCGCAFRKCAEPWMAEQKRHMDVPQEIGRASCRGRGGRWVGGV